MSDPSRPAGEPGPDPTAPYSPPSYTLPGEKPGAASAQPDSPPAADASGAGAAGGGGYTMPSGASDYGAAPTSGSGGYAPPPSSGAGAYTPPPTSGAGGYAPPPSSGAGGYAPPPSSGPGAYAPPPTSGAGGYTQPQTGYGAPPAAGPGGYQPTSGAGYGPTTGGPAYPGYPAQTPGYGPAQGGYPPGYPAAGYGQAPAGYANNDEKSYAMIAHWGGVAGWFIGAGLLGWVGPLIAYLGKGTESPTVRAHAVTSLNFHLTWTGAYVVSWILAFCTFGVSVFVVWIIAVIFSIIGSVKATNGEYYRYPMAIPFVK